MSLKVWNGSAFVDGEPAVWNGSEFVAPVSIHIWDGTEFQRVWAPAEYGGVGTGSYKSTPVPDPFNLTATPGADVFVVVTTDRPTAIISGATYGGVAGTEIASADHGAAGTDGSTKVFRFRRAGDGTAKAVLAVGSGPAAWWAVNAFYWTLNSIGTPTYSTGDGATLSQSVSGPGAHIFSVSGGGGGVAGGSLGLSNFSGATNRINWRPSSVGFIQAISTVSGAGTVTAAMQTADPWAGIFIPIR